MTNRPVNFSDPTGHRACLTDEECKETGLTPSGKTYLDLKGYSSWERRVLRKLYDEGGVDAMHGVEYMLANDIHIKIGESYQCIPQGGRGKTGSTMTCTGDWQSKHDISGWYEGNDYVVLNPNDGYSNGQMPDAWGLSSIIHEARHIEQGYLKAFTKGGELEGYQVGLRVYMSLEGKSLAQLGAYQQDMYNSKSGWEYGQKVKQYLPGYWNGLKWLPPFWQP